MKINNPEAVAVKQEFCSCVCKNNGFKMVCEISCALEGKFLVDFEDQKDLNVSDNVVISKQDWCHGIWDVYFLSTDHSYLVIDIDLQYVT
jgi:hypothetical protein